MAIDEIKDVSLVVGLGNPGKDYERTYHNAGRLALAALAPETGWRARDKFRYVKDAGLTFASPETFMNESGDAVAAALKYFKLKPAELLVIHDDSDLPLGQWKLQFGRGSAGHRGVASIISRLKTEDFWRLRIGIRDASEKKRRKAGDFVLDRISAEKMREFDRAVEEIRKELL
ncbi:aminoacyl-tRNA hydrolase [Patescibacteria group bacterium]|nr:aminoacyl-tRNA hydrolase [Patescibacteria group bacterium]